MEGADCNLGDLLLAQTLYQLGLSYVGTAVCSQAIVVSLTPGMGRKTVGRNMRRRVGRRVERRMRVGRRMERRMGVGMRVGRRAEKRVERMRKRVGRSAGRRVEGAWRGG